MGVERFAAKTKKYLALMISFLVIGELSLEAQEFRTLPRNINSVAPSQEGLPSTPLQPLRQTKPKGQIPGSVQRDLPAKTNGASPNPTKGRIPEKIVIPEKNKFITVPPSPSFPIKSPQPSKGIGTETLPPFPFRPERVPSGSLSPLPNGQGNVPPIGAGGSRRKRVLTLLQPTLLCRGFLSTKNERKVKGFRSKLSGANTSQVSKNLNKNLATYLENGGSLSRCIYYGYLSPSFVAKRLNNQQPTSLVRQADGYRIPTYESFRTFLSANGGKRSQFGVITTLAKLSTKSGPQTTIKISVNNALVFFVDSRNTEKFNLAPSGASISMMPRSKEVLQVLSEASKISLQKIIKFKKIRKKQKPLNQSQNKPNFEWSFMRQPDIKIASTLIRLDNLNKYLLNEESAAPSELDRKIDVSLVVLAKTHDYEQPETYKWADLKINLRDLGEGLTSKIKQTNSFDSGKYYSANNKPRAIFTLAQNLDSHEDANTQDAINEQSIESDSVDQELEIFEEGTSEFNEGLSEQDEASSTDSSGINEPISEPNSEEGSISDEESFDDPGQMIPEGMPTPTASTCTGTSWQEQLICVFANVLGNLLQNAFSNSK